jgi:xanthine dehydrogenase YagS FAD-binding subunit
VRNFEYVNARSTAQAVQILGVRRGKAKILAGGTDLLDELKEGVQSPGVLVNLKAAKALKYIRFSPATGLQLGALATLAEVAEHAAVRERYAMLSESIAQIASPQIRHVATVGGNLCQRPRCWYYRDQALHCARKGGPFCYAVGGENTYHAILGGHVCFIVHPSDLAPALIAYGARVSYSGPAGPKTLPLEKFFIGPAVDITRENVLGPSDVVESVTVPAPAAGTRGVYLKVRDRQTWDFSTLSVAAVMQMEGEVCRRARIVLGAVAPVPWPAPVADQVLTGARITPEVARAAAEAALAGARSMTQNGYKIPLAKNLVRRAILQAAGIET